MAEMKRPLAVTILCVFIAFGALVGLAVCLSPVAHKIASWYPPYMFLSLVIGLVCTVGFWRMRLWAFYLYSIFFGMNVLVLLGTGHFRVTGIVGPLVVVAIGYGYRRRLR